MPSFIVHGLLPPLLLLALRLAPPRVVLWMLPLTWFGDLDYWIGVHRATTSNVFIVLPALYLWYRWREAHPERATFAAVGAFYLASHLLLDVFAGGVVLFWPLWDQNFFWLIRVVVNTQTGQTDVVSDPGTSSGAPQVAEFFQWISPFEAAMVALTLVATAGTLAYRYWVKRQAEAAEGGEE